MGIKIHHGPDGTYKTSGAIKDDILPVIKSGRTLVTNVRGFSRENAIKVLGKKFVHKDFKVIFVDTEGQEGRDKLARFFHWAPNGAFFVVDEVQRIFKPKWTTKDVALLNYVGGAEQAKIDDRPEDMDTAWDMQRHYNWDFVFTTTSITKVRSEMRDMAKVAIRHYNLGLWRFYKTVEHASDSRGTSKSSQGTIRLFNWVPKKVFALYSSTKTGAFDNTEPRTAFYKDPKLVGLCSFLVIFWGYLLYKPAPSFTGKSDTESVSEVKESVSQVSKAVPAAAVQSDISTSNNVSNVTANNVVSDKDGFLTKAFITGSVYSTVEKLYTFAFNYRNQKGTFTSIDLNDMGYKVHWIKPCKASVTDGNTRFYIYCSSNTFVDIVPKKEFKAQVDA